MTKPFMNWLCVIANITFLNLFLISCGPSREEIEYKLRRNIAITDSINAEIAKENERQLLLKRELIDLKAQLAGAETKLNSINQFKILRTANEKAYEVEEQVRIIEEIKYRIEEVSSQIK